MSGILCGGQTITITVDNNSITLTNVGYDAGSDTLTWPPTYSSWVGSLDLVANALETLYAARLAFNSEYARIEQDVFKIQIRA